MNKSGKTKKGSNSNTSAQGLLASIPQNDHTTIPVVFPNFLTAKECERVIEIGDMLQEYDAEILEDNKASLQYGKRKSLVKWLTHDSSCEWLFLKLQELITLGNKSYQFDIQGFFEGVQFARYESGGHFDWHMDAGPGGRSLRKLSITVQLSKPEDYDEGELEFFGLGNPAPKEQGTAIIFPAFLYHRVRPVTRGSRTSIITWVHGNPFR